MKYQITTAPAMSGTCGNPRTVARLFLLSVTLLLTQATFAQEPDKVQQAVNSIKSTYNNEYQDYITDGQRVVWVKSYKNWTPQDLIIIKKEASYILKFLNEAIQHNRLDALEQLMPNYYKAHGGVKAFAADVIKEY